MPLQQLVLILWQKPDKIVFRGKNLKTYEAQS